MFLYAFASLSPAVLIACAALSGGGWPVMAFAWITLGVVALDRAGRQVAPSARSGLWLNVTLAAVHFPLMALVVWALGADAHLDPVDKFALFAAAGLYAGQVSNANAHELIHASGRWPRRLGMAVYISLLHGHHVSAHLLVHHPLAATAADPNSAPRGMGFWRYLWRAAWGEFRAGLRAENARRRARRAGGGLHPYGLYVGGGLAGLLLAALLAGAGGVIALLGLAAYAQVQLFLSDYVQHYGLRRGMRADGKPVPIGPEHSWNAPQWYSSAMMLNAPRHSDHHVRPARGFAALEMQGETMPTLPYSLPVMAAIALVPPLWRRVMHRRLQRWQTAQS